MGTLISQLVTLLINLDTMNKTILGAVVGAVVVAGVAFYGGDVYGKSQSPMRGGFGANGATFTRGAGARGGANGAGFTAGQIISKDESSITIKMPDGSTKIVLVGGSTQVLKTTTGTPSDLAVGTNVVVTGSANSDGSVTGGMIQIRPAGMNFGGPGGTGTGTQTPGATQVQIQTQ
jgi:hypothetical protein